MATYIVRRLLISDPGLLRHHDARLRVRGPCAGRRRVRRTSSPSSRRTRRAGRRSGERFGLDQPIPIRYVRWLANVVQGDLGYRSTGRPADRVRGLAGAPGVAAPDRHRAASWGCSSASRWACCRPSRQYSKLDFFLTGVTFLGVSIPSFLLGLGGLYLFGLKLKMGPDRGHDHAREDRSTSSTSCGISPCRPAFSGSATRRCSCATRARRCSRSSTRTTSRRPAQRACRAEPSSSRHAFRNALIPIITIIGLSLPGDRRRGRRDGAGVHLAGRRPADGRRGSTSATTSRSWAWRSSSRSSC